jgi:hypothetical protein
MVLVSAILVHFYASSLIMLDCPQWGKTWLLQNIVSTQGCKWHTVYSVTVELPHSHIVSIGFWGVVSTYHTAPSENIAVHELLPPMSKTNAELPWPRG